MSVERKIALAQASGGNQRRKSTSQLADERFRSVSVGSLHSITSSASSHDIINILHLSESSKSDGRRTGASRSTSQSKLGRLPKHESVSSSGPVTVNRNTDLSGSPFPGPSLSRDTSTISLQRQNSMSKGLADYYFSVERERTIEEEQEIRIANLCRALNIWKKRWILLRDQNAFLSERLEYIEEEYISVCNSIKEIYEKKVGGLKLDLRKAVRSKDEMLKEKKSLENSFKHMLEHNKMEKVEFENKMTDLKGQLEQLKSNLAEENNVVTALKCKLAEYQQMDTNNNMLASSNDELKHENKNLKNQINTMHLKLKEANLSESNHKTLFEASLEKLRSLEDLLPQHKARRWPATRGRYVLRVDPVEPIHMYLQDLDHSHSSSKFETQSINSLDSLDSIPEHLDELNDGFIKDVDRRMNGHIRDKDILRQCHSSNSNQSSGARSSYPSQPGSSCSTPSVFSDSQSPITSPAVSETGGHGGGGRVRRHLPLQKSLTSDSDLSHREHAKSCYNNLDVSIASPEQVDIRQAIQSVPDLRQFNSGYSPVHEAVVTTLSASQLPSANHTSPTDEHYCRMEHARKASMDADLMLSTNSLKKNKKKHKRRGSLDLDIILAPANKRGDRNRKNGVIDMPDNKHLKVKRSRASEFADILRKLTSSSTSNLTDAEKSEKRSSAMHRKHSKKKNQANLIDKTKS